VHFTSPIRRYPDILVHRAVKALLRGGKPKNYPAAIEALKESAQRASERERAAMEIEREVVDLYRALLMRDRIGDAAEGTVTALVGSGVFVALDEPFVEVLVKFESMGPDHYQLSDDELSVVGSRSGDTIALGDRMAVVIEDVAIMRRTVYARRVLPDALREQLAEEAAISTHSTPPRHGRKSVFEAPRKGGKRQQRATPESRAGRGSTPRPQRGAPPANRDRARSTNRSKKKRKGRG
jgi:ribonuclease R